MVRRAPPAASVRRVKYMFQSNDTRKYAIADAVNRARAAAQRSGGTLISGVAGLPIVTKRYTVLKSPHVNKKAGERFWIRTNRRHFLWDAPVDIVPEGAETAIADALPPILATRTITDAPALYRLRSLWDTMERVSAMSTSTQASDGVLSSEDVIEGDTATGSAEMDSTSEEQSTMNDDANTSSGSDESDKPSTT